MTPLEILKDLTDRFKQDIVGVFEKSPKRIYIEIKKEALVRVVLHVFRELGARFNTASGVDVRDHMEMLYHFTFDKIDAVFTFRIKLDKSNLEIDSLTPYFEGANWIERETTEVLGITFKNHPDMRRLLLPEDWPEGVYPLRRDYKEWDKNAIRDRGV
ncbi:MAG TPA: NADH-quinone oxidoreductase subunit C [Candidatus Omnitrophota bacterium]|nr:NADH-quinone oxidoreductase subunit C [Candidatus Omnitrophota bacterium]HPD84900.1 NADH-quinone oxidoreductase subunit C [Candidatus Omnitrophota bacterium]HRZ03758.1 NADH-quinone oxidoreductase subunit C [Candidatus Omnitrophota bacterium]